MSRGPSRMPGGAVGTKCASQDPHPASQALCWAGLPRPPGACRWGGDRGPCSGAGVHVRGCPSVCPSFPRHPNPVGRPRPASAHVF